MKGTLYIFIFLFSLSLNSIGQETDTTIESSYGRDYKYRKDKADGFRLIAVTEKENKNLAGALRYFLSAIYEYEIISDSNSIAQIRIEIGEIFQEGQLYDKALEYYTKAELIFLNEGTISENVQLLENIAQVYYDKGEYQKSLNYYKRVEKIDQQNGENKKLISTYFNLVKCLNHLDEFEQSLIIQSKNTGLLQNH